MTRRKLLVLSISYSRVKGHSQTRSDVTLTGSPFTIRHI